MLNKIIHKYAYKALNKKIRTLMLHYGLKNMIKELK